MWGYKLSSFSFCVILAFVRELNYLGYIFSEFAYKARNLTAKDPQNAEIYACPLAAQQPGRRIN